MKFGKIEIKSEILYILFLFVVTEFFNISILKSPLRTIILWGVLGLLLLIFWFGRAFSLYSKKKISKYSNVLMKISLKKDFFHILYYLQYFTYPF